MFIFDASTLILTARIELLDLFLKEIGMQVAIPGEVEDECCNNKKTLDALMIQKALDESKIKVMGIRNKRLVTKLQEDFSMGKGEAAAIALAIHENALLLGIDDKRGIDACKLLGIPFTTALGILIRSHEKNLIDRSTALAKLAALSRHGRYKNSILEDARSRLEEQP
jgi:predicted nucleic acid-binding protein